MTQDRYAPEMPFPAYAFVPGRHPHPMTDSRGHSFQRPLILPDPLEPEAAFASSEFRFAIDLFNSGYYWEAHEAWEQLWVAAGRTGVVADLLKALIKFAAAGGKAREGQPVGVRRHATRAVELLESVRQHQPEGCPCFASINLDDLIREASSLIQRPVVDDTPSVDGRPVLEIQLKLIGPERI
jgi:uncharacterized protein